MLPALKKLIDDGNAIRPEKLAGVLGVALPTIHSWVRRGVIPHYKIERATLFNPVKVAEWWERQSRTAPYSMWPRQKQGRPPKPKSRRHAAEKPPVSIATRGST